MDSVKNIQKKGDFEVEVAGPGDVKAYKDIRIEALTKNPEAFGRTLAEILSKPEEYWEGRLDKEDSFIVLAKVNSTPKGAKSMVGGKVVEGGLWQITALYTRPEFRKHGLGESVLRKTLEEIKKRGGERAMLNVTARPEQKAARALYKKFNFKEVIMYREDGEDIYKMEVDLSH